MELKSIHLVGMDEVAHLSHKKVSPLKWTLDHRVVKHLFTLLGRPHLDLFPSAENAQLLMLCSWQNDPLVLAVNVLSIPWAGMIAYTYTPVALIQHIMRKIELDCCRVILIVLIWPRRHGTHSSWPYCGRNRFCCW